MEGACSTIFCCVTVSDDYDYETGAEDYSLHRKRPRGRSRTPRGNVNAWLGCDARTEHRTSQSTWEKDKLLEICGVRNNPKRNQKEYQSLREKGRRRRSPKKKSGNLTIRNTVLHCRHLKSGKIAKKNESEHAREGRRQKGRRRRKEDLHSEKIRKRKGKKCPVIIDPIKQQCTRDTSVSTKSIDSCPSVRTQEETFEVTIEYSKSLREEKFEKRTSSSLGLLRSLSSLSQKVHSRRTRIKNRFGKT